MKKGRRDYSSLLLCLYTMEVWKEVETMVGLKDDGEAPM